MKKKRIIQLFVIILILLLFSPFVLLHIAPVQEFCKTKLEQFLIDKLQKKVYIEKLRFSLRGYLFLHKLEIYDTADDTDPVMSVNRLEVKLNPLPLLQKQIQVSHILVDSPVYRLIISGGKPAQVREREEAGDAETLLPVLISRLDISNGKFYFRKDEPFNEMHINDIDLSCSSDTPGTLEINKLAINGIQYSRKPEDKSGFTLFARADTELVLKLTRKLETAYVTGKMSVVVGNNDSKVDISNIQIRNFISPYIDCEFQTDVKLKDVEEIFNVVRIPLRGNPRIEGTVEGPLQNPVIRGHLNLPDLRVQNLHFLEVNAPFTYWNRDIEVNNLYTEFENGIVRADLLIHTRNEDRGIQGTGKFEQLDLEQVLSQFKIPMGVSGKLHGGARFSMDRFRKDNLNATGWVYSNFTGQIESLHLPVGFDAGFSIQNRQVIIHKALLRSDNSYIVADGTVGFDRTVDLRYEVHTDDLGEISRRIEYNQAKRKSEPIQTISPDVIREPALLRSSPTEPVLLKSAPPVFRPKVPLSGHGTLLGTATGTFRAVNFSSKFELENGNLFTFTWEYLGGDLRYNTGSRQLESDHLILVDKAGRIEARATIDLSYLPWVSYRKKDEQSFTLKSIFPRMNVDVRFTDYAFLPINRCFKTRLPVNTLFSGDIAITHTEKVFIANGNVTGKYTRILDEGLDQIIIPSFHCTDTSIEAETIHIVKGNSSFSGSGKISFDGNYSIIANRAEIDLSSLEFIRRSDIPLTGSISFTGSASGHNLQFTSMQIMGNVDNFVYRDSSPESGKFMFRTHDKNVMFELANVPGSIQINGSFVPEKTFTLTGTLSLHEHTVSSLIPFFTESEKLRRIHGEITSSTQFTFSPLEPGQGFYDTLLEDMTIQFSDYMFVNDDPVSFRFSGNTFTLSSCRIKGSNTLFTVSGSVLPDKSLDFFLEGRIGLEILKLYYEPIHVTKGDFDTTLKIRGTVNSPELEGTAGITGGELKLFDIPDTFTDINGLIRFERNIFKIDHLQSRFGGGTVNVTGDLDFKKEKDDYLAFVITGNNVRLPYPQGLASIIDNAELQWTGPLSNTIVSGSLEIREAVYQKDINYRIMEWDAFVNRILSRKSPHSAPPPVTGMNPKIDIQILSKRSFYIDNNLLNAELTPNIKLTGTVSNIIPVGNIYITRGEITYKSTKFDNAQGVIYFSDPERINPDFNVTGSTKKSFYSPVDREFKDYSIYIHLTGSLDAIQADFSSDPVLPMDELALLLGLEVIPIPIANTQRALEKSMDFLWLSRFQINPVLQTRAEEFFGDGLPIDLQVQVTLGFDFMLMGRKFRSTYIRNVMRGEENTLLLEVPWNKYFFLQSKLEKSGGGTAYGGTLKFHLEFD